MFEKLKSFFGFGTDRPTHEAPTQRQEPEAHIPGPARGEAAGIGAMQAADEHHSETEESLRRATAPNGERRDPQP